MATSLINSWDVVLNGLHWISSICVDNEKNIFICDQDEPKIMVYNESGHLLGDCPLKKNNEPLIPFDICSVSPNKLIVACQKNKLCFLDWNICNNSPELQLKDIMKTKRQYISLCCFENKVYACDSFLRIDILIDKGKECIPIKPEEDKLKRCLYHRIRPNLSTKTFSLLNYRKKLVSIYDMNGTFLRSIKNGKDQEIFDICIDNAGYSSYFCDKNGIFPYFSQNSKIETPLKMKPRICFLENKMVLCKSTNNKYTIEIFNIQNPQQILNNNDMKPVNGYLECKLNIPNLELMSINSDQLTDKTSAGEDRDPIINLPILAPDTIQVIVSAEDNHIFICAKREISQVAFPMFRYFIIEFTENIEFVCEYAIVEKCLGPFSDIDLVPNDMCCIHPKGILVACGNQKKLYFLERESAQLKFSKIVNTIKGYISVCNLYEMIFATDKYYAIDFLNAEGTPIKFVKNPESEFPLCSQIRGDQSMGTILVLNYSDNKIYNYTWGGILHKTIENDGMNIIDFCIDEKGQLFACNEMSIFLLSPHKKCLFKGDYMCVFQKIFALKNQIFALVMTNGNCRIQVFNIS